MAPVALLCQSGAITNSGCYPNETAARFAENHDVAVAASLTRLLDTAPLTAQALATAHLPLHLGGLGLTPATATATPAYWADTVRVPQQASAIQRQFSHPNEATPAVRAAAQCADQLRQTGWEPPTWPQLATGEAAPQPTQAEGPTTGRGWQQPATHACHMAHRVQVL